MKIKWASWNGLGQALDLLDERELDEDRPVNQQIAELLKDDWSEFGQDKDDMIIFDS